MGSVLVLIGMAVAAAAGLPDGMLKDMAAFDRDYISALACLERDDAETARRALGRVEDAWRDMEKEYGPLREDDRFWQTDFRRIDEQLARAKTLLDAAAPLQEARAELMKVDGVFQEIRQRYEVPYYLDGLSRFRQSLGQVVALLADRKPETLRDDDVLALGFLRESLDYAWKIIAGKAPDAALFDLDDKDIEEVAALEKAVAFALDQFGTAITEGDTSRIKQSGLALEAPFGELYNFFGDFEVVGKDTW